MLRPSPSSRTFRASTNPADGTAPVDFWTVTAAVTSQTTIPTYYAFDAIAICATVAE